MPDKIIELLSVQEPADIGTDENSRVRFSVNFEALGVAPVLQWEKDIVKILSDAGLATLGTDTFIGSAAVIPSGDGPYLNLMNTGGSAPMETHNGDKYQRMSIQIIVRAKSYFTARDRAISVWRELDGKRNISVAA